MISRISRLFKKEQDEPEHGEFRKLSSDYIDGELDEAEVAKVNEHLEWCPPCQSFFATLRATIGLLGSSKKQEASPSFRKRLRERLHSESGQ